MAYSQVSNSCCHLLILWSMLWPPCKSGLWFRPSVLYDWLIPPEVLFMRRWGTSQDETWKGWNYLPPYPTRIAEFAVGPYLSCCGALSVLVLDQENAGFRLNYDKSTGTAFRQLIILPLIYVRNRASLDLWSYLAWRWASICNSDGLLGS